MSNTKTIFLKLRQTIWPTILKLIKKNNHIYSLAKKIWYGNFFFFHQMIQTYTNKYKLERKLLKLSRELKEKGYSICIENGKLFYVADGMKFSWFRYSTINGVVSYINEIAMKEIRRKIKNDTIMLDVGANVGFYSLLLSKYIKKGKIISFEPSSEFYKILQTNHNINKLNNTNFPIYNVALSDHNGIAKITANYGGGNHIQNTDKNAEKIKVITGDYLMNKIKLKKLDIVKVDVEGHELNVLKGMQKSIKKFKPLLFVEVVVPYMERYGHKPEDLFNFMGELGYDYLVMLKNKSIKKTTIKKDLKKSIDFMFYYKQNSI